MTVAIKQALLLLVLFCSFSFWITANYFSQNNASVSEITQDGEKQLSTVQPLPPKVEVVRSECASVKDVPIIRAVFNRTTAIESDYMHNTKVLIMSLPRSGSSFLGELFKQNSQFIYLYEVTRALLTTDKCTDELPAQHAEILQNMFRCDFRQLREKMDQNTWDPRASWQRAMKSSSEPRKIELCFPNLSDSLDKIEERSQQNIALKEIFFWSPKINWLYNNVAADLKVLWLVRDVRGWVSSFLQPEPNTHSDSIYEGWHYQKINFWKDYEACKYLDKINPEKRNQIQSLLTDLSAPMHKRLAALWAIDTALTKIYLEESSGKYFLVQYEHLSSFTFGTTQQIYHFIGHSVPNEVLQWLAKATKQGDEKDRYSTHRNSNQMASIWTKRLSLQQILDIEAIASDMFSFFEYTPILQLLKNSTK